jgi:hypothetical protein
MNQTLSKRTAQSHQKNPQIKSRKPSLRPTRGSAPFSFLPRICMYQTNIVQGGPVSWDILGVNRGREPYHWTLPLVAVNLPSDRQVENAASPQSKDPWCILRAHPSDRLRGDDTGKMARRCRSSPLTCALGSAQSMVYDHAYLSHRLCVVALRKRGLSTSCPSFI